MFFKIIILSVLVTICSAQPRAAQYIVPPAKLEAIYPAGLRVTVPDDGFSLFAFHGKLNEEMEGLESGHWSRDITKAKNGVWTFRDRNAQLKLGDKIYFWTYVIKDGLGYRQDNGEWTVTEFVNENGNPVDVANPPVATSTTGPLQIPQQASTPIVRPEQTCQTSETVVQGRDKICKGTLIFSDEFEKNSLKDLTSWGAEVRFPEEPDYPFNVYTTDGTIGFDSGSLIISPVLLESKFSEDKIYQDLDLTNRCTGQIDTTECKRVASGSQILPPVMTGKVTTRHKFGFKYGRIEVRVKLPAGNWLIPEVNLEPHEKMYGPRRYESGLMRIAFTRGNAVFSKKLYAGPVLSDTEPFRSKLMKEKLGIENWNKEYHNYTMIWKPNGIEVLVDGEQFGVVDPGEGFYTVGRQNAVPHAAQWLKGTIMAPLDQIFYISLGLRVGGVHDFTDNPDKPWKNRNSKAMLAFWNDRTNWLPTWYDAAMRVDYVRVYAL
ncbi:beta-1,3-glucan-binding protein-like [Bombyx mandarina]|uniref:Beta-1,3-glucan recognition protein 3 n=3 Tax=Bombyx TaxID=7090 RepID=B5BSX8_BOMMO|nr:beta-1,3-glucan recognition protein 3 precursor [Bombyx mori]XP_028029185.1 beta-1,3-glucan-binding protein-like [Bombyx mandarina]BAG70413.1 beta-1,3-glucan recognition protein 3 [Bombyx mori]